MAVPVYIFPVCQYAKTANIEEPVMGSSQAHMSDQAEHSGHSGHSSHSSDHVMVAEAAHMVCYYTARAELGVGLLVIFGSLALFFCFDSRFRAGVFLMLAGSSILGGLLPTWLIGVCPGASMPCRVGTLPALVVLSAFFLVFCLICLAINAGAAKNVRKTLDHS
jgi:hypothetical protein